MDILFSLTVLCSCLVMALFLSRKAFDVPFLFVMHLGILMGIPPVLHALGLAPENHIFQINYAYSTIPTLCLIMVIYTIGTIVGFLLFKPSNILGFLFPDYQYDRSDKMITIGVIVLTLLSSAVALAPLSAANYNILDTIAEVRHHGFFYQGLNFVRQFIFFALSLSGIHMVSQFKKYRETGQQGAKNVATLMLYLFIYNLFLSILLGGKSFVIFPLSAVLLAYEITRKKINYNKIVLGVLLIASVIVTLQIVRTNYVGKWEADLDDNVYTGLYFIVYDSTLAYVEFNETYLKTELGEDFSNSFTTIIPRILWADKPDARLSAGSRFARDYQPQKPNAAGRPPYGMAQWYVNFGWLGTLIGGMLTGCILSSVSNRYNNYRDDPFSFMIIWYTIFLVLGPWPGGVHNTSLLNYLIYIFPLFIFKWLTRRQLYALSAQT